MLNCKDATRLASEAMDRDIPFRRRFGVRFHLLLCRSCERFSLQIHKLRDILRAYPVEEGGPLDDPNGPCLCQASRDKMNEVIRDELKRCECGCSNERDDD